VRLSHRDYDALLECILELHDRAPAGAFLIDAPRVMCRLFPCDYFAILAAEVSPSPVELRVTGAWETSPRVTQEIAQRMSHFFPSHPFTGAMQKKKTPSPLLFSDFFSDRQLLNQGFYHDLYRLVGIGRCVAIGWPAAHGAWFLSANRPPNTRDFTERDRQVMALLRPHFEQAFRTAELTGTPRPLVQQELQDRKLTPREIEVAMWVSQGKSNPEIATILQLSPRTVEKHVERVLVKLGVENRTAVALLIASPNLGQSRRTYGR